jgi:hypothetical protein
MHSTVSSASQALAGAVTGSTGALAGTPLTVGGAGGGLTYTGSSGGGGGTQIVLDMRGSQIMSDRDMDELASRIGRRLSTVTLVSAGVRVNNM